MRQVLIDAGPLVAFLDRNEPAHDWAKEAFGRFGTFHTCEAVIAEACARRAYAGLDQAKVIALVERDVIQVRFQAEAWWLRIHALMEQYADQPMDFADACLVCMAEEYEDITVVTLDRQDFTVYRRNGRAVIPFYAPPL